MKQYPYALLAILLSASSSFATDSETGELNNVAALPKGETFKFLLGDWHYSFENGDGSTSYRQAHDGAIHEFPEGKLNERLFTGSSLIFFNGSEWRKQWVDTLGNNISSSMVIGEYEASSLPALISSFRLGDTFFRHVFYDIGVDRFEADLLVSTDGGEIYFLARRMPYLRRP